MEKLRDNKLDSIKGFLILLVVLGHCLQRFSVIGSPLSISLINIIFVFHMPLFIILSGYFSRKKDIRTFWESALSILETFLVCQVCNCILSYVINEPCSFFSPAWTMWYFICLLIWKLIIQFFSDSLLSSKFFFIVSSLFAFFIIYVSLPLKGITTRLIAFFPFFLYGYYSRYRHISITENRFTAIFIIPVALSIVFFIYSNTYFIDVFSASKNITNIFDWSIGTSFLYHFLFTIVTISNCVFILTKFPSNRLLASIGKNSLLYYACHGVMIRVLMEYLPRDSGIMISFGAFIIISGIIYLFQVMRLSFFICRPITSIIRTIKNRIYEKENFNDL